MYSNLFVSYAFGSGADVVALVSVAIDVFVIVVIYVGNLLYTLSHIPCHLLFAHHTNHQIEKNSNKKLKNFLLTLSSFSLTDSFPTVYGCK